MNWSVLHSDGDRSEEVRIKTVRIILSTMLTKIANSDSLNRMSKCMKGVREIKIVKLIFNSLLTTQCSSTDHASLFCFHFRIAVTHWMHTFCLFQVIYDGRHIKVAMNVYDLSMYSIWILTTVLFFFNSINSTSVFITRNLFCFKASCILAEWYSPNCSTNLSQIYFSVNQIFNYIFRCMLLNFSADENKTGGGQKLLF